MPCYLGVDLGSTKTHTLIVDEAGRTLGFGQSGAGNHEDVGYEGMLVALQQGLEQALRMAGLARSNIIGAGFGLSGYDWPSEAPAMAAVIDKLGLGAPYIFVNDTVPGLVAGSEQGWGVVVVSGRGSNCRGWDREHQREGRVSGHGVMMGEGAGASELIHKTMQAIGYAWSKRGPMTALADAFVKYAGAKNLEDLIRGYTVFEYPVGADAAPIVFRVAAEGDTVARELIRWAGVENGEMANAVICQLGFEHLEFDVVMAGSMFEGGPMMIEPMGETIRNYAPGARLVRLNTPPVVGAVILGMEAAGVQASPSVRKNIVESIPSIRNVSVRQP